MKKNEQRSRCVLVVFFFGVILNAMQQAKAYQPYEDDKVDAKSGTIFTLHGRSIQPFSSATVDLTLPSGMTYQVGVHVAEEQTRAEGVDAYLEPIFALKTFAHKDTSIPAFIKDFENLEDGKIQITTEWILSDQNLLDLAAEELFKSQPGLMEKWKYKHYTEIKMKKLPLMQVTMRCFMRGDSSRYENLLATAQTGSVVRFGDTFELSFYVSLEIRDKMVGAYKDKKLCFVPYYRSNSYRMGVSKIETIVDFNQSTTNKLDLSSEQMDGSKPIFQEDSNRVISKLEGNFNTRIYASSPTLIPVAKQYKELQEFIFNTVKYSKEQLYDPANAALLSEIRAYLAPHLRQMESATGKTFQNFSGSDDSKTNILRNGKQTTDSTTTGIGISSNANFGVVGGGVSGSKTWHKEHSDFSEDEKNEQIVKSLQETTGVTFTLGESKSEFIPHTINVYRLKEEASNILLKDVVETVVVLGEENQLLEDSLVPSTFTESVLIENIQILIDQRVKNSLQ